MMNAFDRLAPFIQDYIFRNKWQELREIQVASCDAIFNTNDNLLLTSGTASGKTEAAFLPILTELYNKPSKSVGVLYISPLKALINDQFERIEELLIEANIPVHKWHGDVSQSKKDKLKKNPQGILQITPESLESMLTYRKNEVYNLFNDLRFIVIDEVHYFIGENRGIQLQSILERINRIAGCNPRRVGLSATVGNIEDVSTWLSEGTSRKTISPQVPAKKRTLHIAVDAGRTEISFYEKLYDASLNKRSIIFSNSKEEVELNVAHLKEIAKKKGTKDVYHVHHGNISGGLREFTEDQMKNSEDKIVTGATVTLELGIDVGDLERTIETGSPFSASSFVQRLGRSGRKTGVSEMMFIFNKKNDDDTEQKNDDFVEQIDWDILLSIAIIDLYLKEKWVEPLDIAKYPFPVLYHQIMCYLTSVGSSTPQGLAQYMLTLSPFKNISQEDLKILLRFMIEKEQIELDEEGNILVGLNGEKIVNRYQFLTVFENEIEYSVRDKTQEIGTISTPVPAGETLILAGQSWKVLEVNVDKRQIFVEKIPGISKTYWLGPTDTNIHTKITKKVKEILESTESYPYVREEANALLEKSRQIYRNTNLDKEILVPLSNHNYGIFTFIGTKEFSTLRYLLKEEGINAEEHQKFGMPIYLEVKNTHDKNKILQIIETIKTKEYDIESINVEGAFIREKNNEYVPSALLEKHFKYDFLKINELKDSLIENKKELGS